MAGMRTRENGGNENRRDIYTGEICTGQLCGRIVAGKQGKGSKPATRRRREQLTAKQINWRNKLTGKKEAERDKSLSSSAKPTACWSSSPTTSTACGDRAAKRGVRGGTRHRQRRQEPYSATARTTSPCRPHQDRLAIIFEKKNLRNISGIK